MSCISNLYVAHQHLKNFRKKIISESFAPALILLLLLLGGLGWSGFVVEDQRWCKWWWYGQGFLPKCKIRTIKFGMRMVLTPPKGHTCYTDPEGQHAWLRWSNLGHQDHKEHAKCQAR